MAEAARLILPPAMPGRRVLHSVAALRIVIVAATLAGWQLLAVSGLLYRDVVPSLTAIALALYKTVSEPSFYFHLSATFYEVAVALVIGGMSGLAVGVALGASPFLSRAYEACLYYLGPTPKIIFFPVMIMWFGVGPGSKIAMGAISCFFPIALNSRPACARSIRSWSAWAAASAPAPGRC